MPILFTPGQLMAALSLSKQQWRTYRQALSPLSTTEGRSGCFTAGDLLATAVIQYATDTLHMSVSALSPVADALYDVCGSHPWIPLERGCVALILDDGRAILLDEDQRPPVCKLAVLIELRPLVLELRDRLLAAGRDPQQELAFPPMFAGGRS
ncbi:hypothetical protein [Hoeflea sp. BAL378]|uniref:hypothetical protein n=1 Tax=Hoeflea sp. BAL378 TaxID=1547437 RepID=UPI00126A18B5|nr:hypothetical protein [Hoeflea sp. BAL378]